MRDALDLIYQSCLAVSALMGVSAALTTITRKEAILCSGVVTFAHEALMPIGIPHIYV